MHPSRLSVLLRRLEKRFFIVLIAICAKHMKWFASFHAWLHGISKNARTDFGKLVALLFCIPCFQASHFFFKAAYALQQRRLRMLCGKEFFAEFYSYRIARGGIIQILQSPRKIERALERAETSEKFSSHGASPAKLAFSIANSVPESAF